jgi:hypothetical protein
MGTILLTDCCGVSARNWSGAGGSVWGHVDTCRKCDKQNPVMVQVDTSEHFKCCWAPKYLGHFFGCPNSPERNNE